MQYDNYSVQNVDSDLLTQIKLSSLSLTNKATKTGATGTTTSSSSKKKGRKKKNNSNAYIRAANEHSSAKVPKPMRLLKDLLLIEREPITARLDVGYGANWKQIAVFYHVKPEEIRAIESAKYTGESPTESLFQLLLTRIPDLSLEDLKEKCTKIERMDIVLIIDELSSKGGRTSS